MLETNRLPGEVAAQRPSLLAALLIAVLAVGGPSHALADSIRAERERLAIDMKAGRNVQIFCDLGGRHPVSDQSYAPLPAAQADTTADRPMAYLSAQVNVDELQILTPEGLHVWLRAACRLIHADQD